MKSISLYTRFYKGFTASPDGVFPPRTKKAVRIITRFGRGWSAEEVDDLGTAPLNTSSPLVVGEYRVGQTLTATVGEWIGTQPIAYSFRWTRDGVDIPGASQPTYLVSPSDVGKSIRVRVTAENAYGSGTANSPNSGVIPPNEYQFVNPEAAALVARFDVQPDDVRKALIDEMWTRLKVFSFYAKLDSLVMLAAHHSQAARVNWIGAGLLYNVSLIGGPTFVVDRGFATDGVQSYLDTNFNPATATPKKFSQNSGFFAVRSNLDTPGGSSYAGFYETAQARGTTINPKNDNSAGITDCRLNSGATVTASSGGVSPNSIGMYVANRVGSADIRGYKNGSLFASNTYQSQPLANGTLRLGSIGPGYRGNQFSFSAIGSGLTNQEVLDLFNWFNVYRVSIGLS